MVPKSYFALLLTLLAACTACSPGAADGAHGGDAKSDAPACVEPHVYIVPGSLTLPEGTPTHSRLEWRIDGQPMKPRVTGAFADGQALSIRLIEPRTCWVFSTCDTTVATFTGHLTDLPAVGHTGQLTLLREDDPNHVATLTLERVCADPWANADFRVLSNRVDGCERDSASEACAGLQRAADACAADGTCNPDYLATCEGENLTIAPAGAHHLMIVPPAEGSVRVDQELLTFRASTSEPLRYLPYCGATPLPTFTCQGGHTSALRVQRTHTGALTASCTRD